MIAALGLLLGIIAGLVFAPDVPLSLQNYLPSPDPVAAADWLARTLDAVADHRDAHPDRVVFARLDGDAAEAAAAIEQALGLPQPLPGLHGRVIHVRGDAGADGELGIEHADIG